MDDNGGAVRIADYIVVIAFDESQIRHGNSVGNIVQRLPQHDWPDISLSPNLEVFSQPQGWSLSAEVKPATFFVNTLTDILGSRQYAYCLQVLHLSLLLRWLNQASDSFQWEEEYPEYLQFVNLDLVKNSLGFEVLEQVQEPCGSIIEDVDDVTLSGATLYKPKVIVILSRFPFFELFRNCLNRFHVALLDSEYSAEAMTATLLSSTKLVIGAPPVSFNFASERLCVRAPLSRTVPVTSDKVALFMRQLGTIQNVLSLLSAILTDRKVLFRSCSMSRLADSCYAICALLYPFEYPHTFVPVLPEQLIEYLESPTPYIMGLLHSVRNLNVELDTTIVVDLDIGAVYIPPMVTLPFIPEPFAQRFISSLQMVLNPGLSSADDAWKMGQPPHPSCEVQDKRIRACFIRFFADIVGGYRCCLEVVRLHTPPLIVFHKSAFLGLRGFSSCSLIRTFLDSLLFQSFICERGLPFRVCDLFDDLVSHSHDYINGDQSKVSIMESIANIAEKLRDNEHQDSSFSMTPLLTNKRFLMSNVPTKLPLFDEKLARYLFFSFFAPLAFNNSEVARFMDENRKRRGSTPHCTLRPRKVPMGNWFCMKEERLGAVSRRLQVLSSCLHYIFDLKLSDARKMLCAVELSMRSVNARVALCQLLWLNLNPVNRATLLPQQFELIIRLINCALNQESKEDEHGIAYAMLYLSNIYCRRLTAGVHQFAYTCIQEHPVWENEQFWEAAFFHDVHRQLRRLYMPIKEDSDCPFSVQENATDTWNLMEEPSGMDLVSERLASISRYDEGELKMRAAEENSIIFGQAKHYINLMVYLRIPLDVSKLRRVNVRELERRSDRSGRRREMFDDETVVSESESDVESGFIESDDGDLGNATVKWIRRLIDRICSAAGLEHAQIERLCDEIPGFVALHIDNLEQVYTESKRLSPMHKPKLLQPALLLPSERILLGGMRVFLLNDGRSVGSVCGDSPQSLLPAEGAIFLTNYRLVFKGQPCDPFLCEQVVIRTVAVMSITKEKQIADQSIQNSSQLDGIPTRVAHQLHDAFQIRSANAQLMKVAFDEEVSSEKAEEFLQTLASLRWPPSLPHTLFAYSAASTILSATFAKTSTKHKYGTIRELKKTLIRNPLKDKKRARTPLKALAYPKGHETMPVALSAGASPTTSRSSHASDYLDLSDVTDLATSQLHHHYMVDYERLGLTHRTFRLSNINSKYELSKSYPSVVVVPLSVADESFAKIGKGFKHGRFPVVTWKSEDDALLIRGAGLASQTVVTRIKKQANLLGNVDTQGSAFVGSRVSLNSRDFGAPNSVEMQERYMSTFVALSPHVASVDGRSLLSESMESLLSLDSMVTFDGISLASATPDIYRKTQTSDFTRHATNFVRSSGGKTTVRSMNNGRNAVYGDYMMNQARRATTFLPSSQTSRPLLSLSRNSLYVFGDRNQAKILKLDKGCEFIPVSYPSAHNVKIAFKKFLRAVCPSWASSEEHTISFYKQLDDSSWLQMISSLLHLSNAVVDLIDLQHSSVCICIEDGWDATCQIMALSQLLLDPYYRTLDGFRVLIEKEWLAFGHRFSHRANHSIVSQNSGIAPMFLMFLDAVHQVCEQTPSAFEFNDFFLRFLAYHSSSACFRTFVLDSECERITFDTLCVSACDPRSASIWTYINEKRQSSPIFNNFCYTPDLHGVLRPQASIASLTLWSLFSEDHLAHGSPYDIEVADIEEQEREDEQFESLSETRPSGALTRRVLDANYREPHLLLLDGFSISLDNYTRIRALLPGDDEKTNEPWSSVMTVIDTRSAPSVSFTLEDKESLLLNGWRRHVHRAVHKKETVKLLLRGMTHRSSNPRMRESVAGSSTGHHFVSQHVTAGDTCAVCHQNVPGVVVRMVHRCTGCGTICHEKCSPMVSSVCPASIEEKKRPITPKPEPSSLASKRPSADTTADSKTLTMSGSRPYANATHCGFLMKKGATFKMWKPRWFVLDASRHQLRYYESETDVNCRGVIELADIKGVDVSSSHALRKPLIEIRTVRRVYSLLAETKNDADMWMEKILAALRD